jgi:hypothetical protein
MAVSRPYAELAKREAITRLIRLVLRKQRRRLDKMKWIQYQIALAKDSNAAYLMRKHGHLFEGIGPVVG